MKIKDFAEGMNINQCLMVGEVKKGITNSGAPYLSVTFQDDTSSIEGKIWDVQPLQLKTVIPGHVINVRADVLEYRGTLQLKVSGVADVDNSMIDLSDFVVKGPVPIDELRGVIQSAIDQIDNFTIKSLVSAIYQKYDEQIYSSPAASRNHHEFYGGLATHTASMVRLANAMCDLYPELNRDLLIGGVLVHDIGKTVELSNGSVVEYTLEGKLLGHISIAQAIVAEVADELGINGEEVTMLRHLVLSHHGKYEFGSPVLPRILEAEVLHMIDDMDAKITMVSKELNKVKPGEFTSKIISMDGRQFYKPKEI